MFLILTSENWKHIIKNYVIKYIYFRYTSYHRLFLSHIPAIRCYLYSRTLIYSTYKCSLWNGTPLRLAIASEKSSSSIRFAAKCPLTCAGLSALLLPTTWYFIRIIHPSLPHYIVPSSRAWFNVWFNAH